MRIAKQQQFGKYLLVVGVLLVFGAFCILAMNSYYMTKQKNEFKNEVINITNVIKGKTDSYEQLTAGVQQIVGENGIEQDDWDSYFKTIDISNYKGLSSVTYSKRVLHEEKPDYEKNYYKIYPDSIKEEYLPVTFIEPSEELQAYLGFDSGITSPDRYKWIAKARDTNTLQRSDLYTFDPGEGQDKISLMFLTVPVYRPGQPISNLEQKQQNYLGTVLASFQTDDLVPALISTKDTGTYIQDIEIFDSTDSDAAIIYDSSPGTDASNKTLYKTIEAELGNRPLLIAFGANPNKPFIGNLGVFTLAVTGSLLIAMYTLGKNSSRE